MDILKKEISEFDIKPRIESLMTFWEKNFDGVDALIIRDGSDDQDSLKLKTIAIHAWLFKCEYTETILVITKKSIVFFGKADMMNLLQPLKPKLEEINIELHLISRSGDLDDSIQEILDLIEKGTNKKSNFTFGNFQKEKQKGEIVETFDKIIEEKMAPTWKEVGPEIQEQISVKQQEDIQKVKKSANLAIYFAKALVGQMEDVIDGEIKMKQN